jgi:Acetoacetate decarboxylase (ADC)
MAGPDVMTTTPFHEYGGLTSVPGPFECTNASIYVFALKADPDRVETLCSSVLGGVDTTRSFAPLGSFVLLTFGSMTVRSLCTERSTFFGTRYADMGRSVELHAALWIPTEVSHRTDHTRLIDQISMFIPVMWVDNPVSLLGGREIYGIAKQWGYPTITGGLRPSCSLDVYGGAFSQEATAGRIRLFDLSPDGRGAPDITASETPASDSTVDTGSSHSGPLHRLLHGEITLPDPSLFKEAADALVNHHLHQITARQFRTQRDDGTVGSGVELVEVTSTFHEIRTRFLHHKFEFTLHHVDSHPLRDMLGLSSQTVHFGLEVTTDFTLQADCTPGAPGSS